MKSCETSVDLAVEHLRQGHIVAFPTETYYGLAVDPDNQSAVERLFALKNRPVDKPLLLLIENTTQLRNLVSMVPQDFKPLMDKHWPGPLTLVFPALDSVSPKITAGSKTVGVRISPHPIAARLVQKFGKPITATSANLSGKPPAKTALEISTMFVSDIDFILDGGETTAGLCSTIVGLKGSQLIVIRQGEIDIFAA
ncbi:L-threonylcarbamoyladenylate synthase [Desulforhopalus sp. IMCC35007]|uniref:L-threonylcarbamoyladenylate synthase n=1 Tax=Desulforhopalus sp. IMCC35007 TaxID=2569543 RepID=UPI0010ADBD3F|nr:L-threonylcarbamoyladenylate synthase [Desulforhopalus sp. IMCC35007]TKB10344.1 threonylcarbamoyl-AMP synthase [Desulforhopalus sp. IMCC35007]